MLFYPAELSSPRRGAALGVSAPGAGENRITYTPDDERSIGFEVDQMVEYVRQAPKDPDFIALVKDVALSVRAYEGRPDYTVALIAAWFEWCRENVQYGHDPVSYSCFGGT